jgi:hypothetical protein
MDSENISLIAAWVADMLPQIMTKNLRNEWRFRVWASTKKESDMLGQPFMRDEFLTEDGLRKLENLFRRTREKTFPKPAKKEQ